MSDELPPPPSWTPWWIGLFTVVVAGVVWFGLQPPARELAVPSLPAEQWKIPLTFDPPIGIEVSGVRAGVKVPFQVAVRNPSSVDIEVTKVSASCTCTEAEFAQRQIPANSDAVLQGTIEGKPGTKRVSATLTIELVNRATGQTTPARYVVSAEVNPSLRLTSENLLPAPSEPQADGRFPLGSIRAENVGPEVLRFEAIPVSFEPGSVVVAPFTGTINPGQSIDLLVHTTQWGEQRGFLRVAVDGGRESVSTPLPALIMGAATVEPKVLDLGAVTETQDAIQSVNPPRLTVRGSVLEGRQLKISKVSPALSNPIATSVGAEERTVDFTLAPQGARQAVAGEVRLDVVSSDGRVVQALQIPVTGSYQKGPPAAAPVK